MRLSCFSPLGPSSERPGALSAPLSAKPCVRSFSSSRPASPCPSLRPRRIRGTGPAAEPSSPGPATMMWWTGPIRSGSKVPAIRPACSISPTSHLRQTPPTAPPRTGPPRPAGPQLVPHPQQALPRSRSGATLLRSRSTCRPSSREFGNSTSNPLRCCLHLVVFDMQVSPLSDGLMPLVRRFKSAFETDAGSHISGDRSRLSSALRPTITGRGAGHPPAVPKQFALWPRRLHGSGRGHIDGPVCSNCTEGARDDAIMPGPDGLPGTMFPKVRRCIPPIRREPPYHLIAALGAFLRSGAYCRVEPKAPTMSDCSKMPAASAWPGP